VGFRDVKRQAIHCLERGYVLHAMDRKGIDVKNLLAMGVVSIAEVADLIRQTKGFQYEKGGAVHGCAEIEMHIMKPVKDGRRWYLKFYFIEPNIIFMSVHL
jgi:hypothetical protein